MMNAIREAIVIAPSNAGDITSVVLRHLRRLAHLALDDPDGIFKDDEQTDLGADVDENALDEDDLAIFEWSAPPGADKWDRNGWASTDWKSFVYRGRDAAPAKR